MLQSGNISERLDRFEKLLEKVTLADGVRVSHSDVTKMREIKKKLEIFSELCKNYVPDKSSIKRDKSKNLRRSMIRSVMSTSEFYSSSMYGEVPEFYTKTDDILKIFRHRRDFIMHKLIDVQKIRIGCLNSELSGLIVNYLVNHMIDSLVGLNRSAIIMIEKQNGQAKVGLSSRAFGHRIEMSVFKDESILKELDDRLTNKGFAKLDRSPNLLKLLGFPANQKGPASGVQTEPNIDHFYCYRHEKPNYISYLIGCQEEGKNYFPDILALHYGRNEKVKSFVDYLLMLLSKHLNEFIMERTNQYFYTWMLFNVEMILASHAIPLICVIIEDAIGSHEEFCFFERSNPLYSQLEKDNEDFICFYKDHTYLVFRKYGFGIGLKRVNCNFYPLYNKVATL